MSGLEVAAGVIAVVQVTGQTAFLIAKIKNLWGEIRDAPEEIQDLLDEVELTSLTLQSIEQQVQQSKAAGLACNSAMEAILKHARSVYQALQKVVDLLDKEIQESRGKTRRFVKSTKVILKKPVLDRLKNRLEFSLKLLALSSYVQVNAMVAQSTAIIFERLPNAPSESSMAVTSACGDTVTDETAKDASEQSQITHSNIMSRHRLQGFDPRQVLHWSWTGRFKFNFSSDDEGWILIQPPSWLAHSTHVLIAKKLLGGPQLALRRYDIIERWDQQVLDSLKRDDWPSLEMHLRTTGTSLFAMTKYRENIVYFACWCKSIKILKRLVGSGLEAHVDNTSDQPSLHLQRWEWLLFHCHTYGRDLDVSCEMQRILLSHGLDVISNNFDSLLRTLKFIPVTELKQYLEWFMPDIQNFSQQQRIQIACSLLPSTHDNDIGVWLPELRDPPTVSEEPSCIKGSNLMHHLAQHLAWLAIEGKLVNPDRKVQRRLQWIARCAQEDPEGPYRTVRADSLTFDSELYKFIWLAEWHVTPLMAYLFFSWEAMPSSTSFLSGVSSFYSSFRSFLSSFQDAGIDLAALGRNERQLHLGSIEIPRLGLPYDFFNSFGMDASIPVPRARSRLFGISFGHRVTDWVIWWAWEYEHLAMEFWNMVENPPSHMPGSWVDEKSEWESEEESFLNYCNLNDETSFIWSEVVE